MAKPPRLLLGCWCCCLFFVFLCTSSASSSFSFPDFSAVSIPLHSLLFFGDARPSPPSVLLSASPFSSGTLLSSPAFPFPSSLSFSSSFCFSMRHPTPGDTFAFVIVPLVELDSSMNQELQCLSVTRLHSLFSLPAAVNLSGVDAVLPNSERLYAWVEYHSPAQLLQVRLGKNQTCRPADPLFSHRVDLSSLWNQEVYVGFSSTMGAIAQGHTLYSWHFNSWDGTQHSFPADPSHLGQPRRAKGFVKIALALLLGVACASTTALSVVLIWALMRRMLSRPKGEIVLRPITCGYEQIVTDEK